MIPDEDKLPWEQVSSKLEGSRWSTWFIIGAGPGVDLLFWPGCGNAVSVLPFLTCPEPGQPSCPLYGVYTCVVWLQPLLWAITMWQNRFDTVHGWRGVWLPTVACPQFSQSFCRVSLAVFAAYICEWSLILSSLQAPESSQICCVAWSKAHHSQVKDRDSAGGPVLADVWHLQPEILQGVRDFPDFPSHPKSQSGHSSWQQLPLPSVPPGPTYLSAVSPS